MASSVMSMRLAPRQKERLQRLARRLGRTPSDTGALLIEESLRREEFAFIDFRESAAGRQACVQGSSLAVWEVVMIAQDYAMDATKTATHLKWPVPRVQAALNYAEAFPEEIKSALDDNDSYTFEQVQRMLPQARAFLVPSDATAHD